MTKYLLPVLAIAILFCKNSESQSTKPLKINDVVPDVSFGTFLDASFPEMKISDFKGKLIILDFWNIHCTACITGMPKMNSLQEKFKDKIQVIYITKNSRQEVNSLFSRIKIKKPDMPFVIGDTIFNLLFPHNGDPLHVWINQNGLVNAITFAYNTNRITIDQFLNGIDPQLSRRWDFGFNYEYNLISEQNSGLLGLLTNYSALFKGVDEYTLENFIRTDENRVQLTNATLLTLYNVAYANELYGFPIDYFQLKENNRLVLEVKDNTSFFPPSDESAVAAWVKHYQFSYELKVPTNRENEKFRYMQEDLRRYFPFNAGIEKRKVKSLVLISKLNGASLKTKDSTSSPAIQFNVDKSFSLQNMPINALTSQLMYSNPSLKIPIIDETNFRFNIDIKLKSKLSNIESVKKELNSYGLDLIVKECLIDMLVIKDSK